MRDMRNMQQLFVILTIGIILFESRVVYSDVIIADFEEIFDLSYTYDTVDVLPFQKDYTDINFERYSFTINSANEGNHFFLHSAGQSLSVIITSDSFNCIVQLYYQYTVTGTKIIFPYISSTPIQLNLKVQPDSEYVIKTYT